jgi:hypothetical protein
MSKPTDAETFANRLNNDGRLWATNDNISFMELAHLMGTDMIYSRRKCFPQFSADLMSVIGYTLIEGTLDSYTESDPVRFVFPDGSVIVMGHEEWDFEGDTPFSFKG